MGLDQQLADFKAGFARTAPAGRAALYEAKIEELRASFALEAAAGVGAVTPEFRLPAVASILAIPVLGEVPLPEQRAAIVAIAIGVCLAAKRPLTRSTCPNRPVRGG
jgi:hypothetical protein